MRQAQLGVVNPLVILGVVILIVVGGALYLNNQSQTEVGMVPTPTLVPTTIPESTAAPTMVTPSTTVKTPTKVPSLTPTLTPKPTNYPHKVTCIIERSDMTGGKAPFTAYYFAKATFDYGGNPVGTDQIDLVQWDFDGDWKWDTEFEKNLTPNYTYTSSNVYNAKMRVKTTDGLVSDICSKDIHING